LIIIKLLARNSFTATIPFDIKLIIPLLHAVY